VELAELAQDYFSDRQAGNLAGPIGGLIVGLLAIVTILLIRNMNARLRRLPERFPDPGDTPDQQLSGQEPDRPEADHRTG
jgi:hypothetical protein